VGAARRRDAAEWTLWEAGREHDALRADWTAGTGGGAALEMMRCSLLVALMCAQLAMASTGCESCCSPGGSCALAFKQTPGICCGRLDATSFCCPPTAKCFRCKSGTYRCFSAAAYEPSCQVCQPGDDPRPKCGHSGNSGGSDGVSLVLGIAVVLGLCACWSSRNRRDDGPTVQMAVPVDQYTTPYAAYNAGPAYGAYPGATPAYGQAYGPSVVVVEQPQHSGYSGGTVAASAGLGFLGGVLAGEAIASSHHHHGDGGGWGGGDGGGWGGGDSGGGDAGFAADN